VELIFKAFENFTQTEEITMALKYERILYCTDFSEDADYAFLTALDMAEKYQAQLFVFHVLHSPYKYMRSVVDDQEDGKEAFISEEIMGKGLQQLKERYEGKMGQFKNYHFQVAGGVPFVEIIRFARAENVDFIVLGAAGKSELDRTAFGSTAENVARRAHCTVMAIRYPEKYFQLDKIGQ
jgi:nucleotide-binding universal stress UspA family protein